MAESNDRENRLMQLDCVRENVENILQEHRMLGLQYARSQEQPDQHAEIDAEEIIEQMDRMRLRAFQLIVNTVPRQAETPEEIGRVSEMIDLLVMATNEFTTDPYEEPLFFWRLSAGLQFIQYQVNFEPGTTT